MPDIKRNSCIEKEKLMNREALLSRCKLLKPLLTQSSSMCKLFELAPNKMSVFNTFQGAVIEYPLEVEGLIEGNLLVDMLSNYSSEEVFINVKDDKLLIKSGNSMNKLSMDQTTKFNFPIPTENVVGRGEVHVLTDDFLFGLSKVLISVDPNGQLPMHRGVCFSGTHLFSSDGPQRASFYELKEGEKLDEPVLLPKVFCDQLLAFSKEFGGGDLIVCEGFVVAKYEGAFLYTSIDSKVKLFSFEESLNMINLDGEFGNVTTQFSEMLKRHSILLKGTNSNLSISFDDKKKEAEFISKSCRGISNDPLSVHFDEQCKGMDLFIDVNTLLQAIKEIKEFKFTKPREDSKLILFVGREDSFIHAVFSYREELI